MSYRISLYAVPAPGQKVKGETSYLGTVRTHMHKAPLTAIAADLRKKMPEIDVRIIDMQTISVDEYKYGEFDFDGITLEKYRLGCPFEKVIGNLKEDDLIGISANFTHSRLIYADFIQFAKKINKNAVIVLGGTDATQDPDYYLQKGADIVVKGESELTFHYLVKALQDKSDLKDIANISFIEKSNIIHNENNFLRKPDSYEMNSLPLPAFDMVDHASYTDTGEGRTPFEIPGSFISIETSRGCAHACSFCATPSTKGIFRFMHIDQIKQHFDYYMKLGLKNILIQEDNVLSRVHRNLNGEYRYPEGRKELLDMFDLLLDMGFKWEFANGLEFGQFIQNGIVDLELIEKLFANNFPDGGGCYRATLPLENLSNDGSKKFKKLKPIPEIMDTIKAIAKTGVPALTFNLIIGRPEDDDKVIQLSYKRCLEIKTLIMSINSNIFVYFNIYNLSVFPGTLDYKKLSPMLAFDLDKHPEVVTFYLACLNTEFFSPLRLAQARGTFSSMINGDEMIEEYDDISYITHPYFENLFKEKI